MSTIPPRRVFTFVWALYIKVFDAELEVDEEGRVGSNGRGLAVVPTIDHDGIVIYTGEYFGPVLLEFRDQRPKRSEWKEHVHLNLDVNEPLVVLEEASSDVPELAFNGEPVFTPTIPGPHRIDVYARGRHQREEDQTEPVEHYLVVITPLGGAVPSGRPFSTVRGWV